MCIRDSYQALRSLSTVIDAASLSYAPFTNLTLGVLCKLYMQDTHEPEGGTPGSVNLRGDLPAYQAMCRVTDALIGVLGPELQDSERVRELVLVLLKEFTLERDDGIAVEAIRATQHFLIFAPDALDHATLVSNLRAQLSSSKQPLKVAAVNSVYQLVQRDAALMSKLGGDGLVQELFALLDADTTIEGVRDAKNVILHMYNAAAPIFRDQVFGNTQQQTIDLAVKHVKIVREQVDAAVARGDRTNWQFEYSPEAFSQTEPDFAVRLCDAVQEAWFAGRDKTKERPIIFNLPATVEVATPNNYADQVRFLASLLTTHPPPRD